MTSTATFCIFLKKHKQLDQYEIIEMVIRFSISRKAITRLIQSSCHPSLKIANCRNYLEPDAGLSGSMRNSNCSMLRGKSRFMILINFRLFLELDLVFQKGMYHLPNLLFRSWKVLHIFPQKQSQYG
jgi:hypothetical protein